MCKLYIWDTAGQEKYGALTKSYYHNCHGVILVYDVTKQDTFDNLDYWIKQIKEIKKDPEIVIVGNKCDLENLRTVSTEVAESKAESYSASFYEASALN